MRRTASAFLPLALCAALASSLPARATEQKLITNADPAASAASGSAAPRTLKFNTHEMVPATFTLRRDGAVGDGFKPRLRFAGQTAEAACSIALPKAGQRLRPGEATIVTVRCDTPWQVYDNGLSFRAFEDGRPVGEGTLRP